MRAILENVTASGVKSTSQYSAAGATEGQSRLPSQREAAVEYRFDIDSSGSVNPRGSNAHWECNATFTHL